MFREKSLNIKLKSKGGALDFSCWKARIHDIWPLLTDIKYYIMDSSFWQQLFVYLLRKEGTYEKKTYCPER